MSKPLPNEAPFRPGKDASWAALIRATETADAAFLRAFEVNAAERETALQSWRTLFDEVSRIRTKLGVPDRYGVLSR